MEALFACAKCHARHPFEELSAAEQFCKLCQKHSDTVRCIYCRVEFQAEDKNGISPVCKNCNHCLKTHGKPKACEYCKEIAAFVGMKCLRCSHQEKKYGSPKLCERCKNMCAFDRGVEYRSTMEGKMLCWLCIVAYKRANKKLQKLESLTVSNSSTRYSPMGNNIAKSMSTPTLLLGEKRKLKDGTISNNGTPNMVDLPELKPEFLKSKDDLFKRASSPMKRKIERSTPASKKGRFEFGLESGEHLTTITQLREDIESLKRQMNSKDQVILQKDQKITELKAQLFELDKDTRIKIQQVQKQNDEIIDCLQLKIRELQKIANSVTSKNGKKSAK